MVNAARRLTCRWGSIPLLPQINYRDMIVCIVLAVLMISLICLFVGVGVVYLAYSWARDDIRDKEKEFNKKRENERKV